jgi:hypothetical protein
MNSQNPLPVCCGILPAFVLSVLENKKEKSTHWFIAGKQ